MTADELDKLINSNTKESLTLDFKSEPYEKNDKSELLKDVTAMANAEGGYIIIGVDERNQNRIFQLQDSTIKDSIKRYRDWCADSIQPRLLDLEVYSLTIGDNPLIVIQIPKGGKKPYCYEINKMMFFKIRVSDSTRDMRRDEIAECFAYKGEESKFGSKPTISEAMKSPIDDFTQAPLDLMSGRLDFDVLKYEKEISRQGPSKVDLYLYRNQNYVVKKTESEVCDYSALKKLIGLRPFGKAWRLESKIAIPLAVRLVENYVFELHPYYRGISLYELALKNEQNIRGDYLGALFDSLIFALNCIHREGLVHRDVRPQNMFLLEDGNICLLDCSFVCELESKAPPINIGPFTSPEQVNGHPTKKSDWYSLAVSVYFLFHRGYPPENFDSLYYNIEEIDLGAFYSNSLLRALSQDPEDRPNNLHDVLLHEHSRSILSDNIISTLDADDLGILVLSNSGFMINPRR